MDKPTNPERHEAISQFAMQVAEEQHWSEADWDNYRRLSREYGERYADAIKAYDEWWKQQVAKP